MPVLLQIGLHAINTDYIVDVFNGPIGPCNHEDYGRCITIILAPEKKHIKMLFTTVADTNKALNVLLGVISYPSKSSWMNFYDCLKGENIPVPAIYEF
jgi:tetrahydromethanopterin S-methyltransferase subunit C